MTDSLSDSLTGQTVELLQTLIRNDYSQSPEQITASGPKVSRRGLTGAEQLAADIARLDDYASESVCIRARSSRDAWAEVVAWNSR